MRFGWGNYTKSFSIFLTCIGLYSCSTPNTTELTRVFQPAYNGKTVKTSQYYHHSGFCSDHFYINADSTFNYEGGCEGNSHPAIGKWYLTKDSIKLVALKRAPQHVSFNTTFSKSSSDKYVTFIILDKTHKPISNFTIQPFNEKPNYYYVDKVGLMTSAENALEKYNEFKTDSLGVLKIRKNKSDSLDFTKLYPLTGKNFRIKNQDLPDTIRLIININGMLLRYDQISYDNDMANHQMGCKYINGKMIY